MLKKLWKQMRWSLRTQVIVVLFVGYLLVLYQWSDPWTNTGVVYREELPLSTASLTSPDKTRWIRQAIDRNNYGIEIFRINDQYGEHPLYESKYWVRTVAFLNDDCFIAQTHGKHRSGNLNPERYAVFRRRFPEWWWGHFYRPEVWLLPLWLGLIVWTIRKDRAVPK